MSRFGVLIAAAIALMACQKGPGEGRDASSQSAKKGARASGETVSVTGVVSGVEPDKVEVRTDDGRQLALGMDKSVEVMLGGGEAESAVIVEGAPVRVSYRPKGAGGDLVAIDVEPQAASARGETKGVPQGDPPANPEQARRGR